MSFNSIIYSTLLFSVFVGLCENVPLPPYFSRCSKKDPRINECIAYNAGGGLHAFVRGDEMYNIQSMTPVYIPKITLNLDRQLQIHLTNSIISDFESARIEDVKMDLENQYIELNMHIPRATLMGQYHIAGKIFLLTFDERGPVNMTVLNSLVKYGFNYVLEERDNKHFINITNSSMTYQPERVHYLFYEFMGNKFLKDIIHKSMNENWVETHQEFEPVVSQAICKVTTKSLKGFFQQVPYEELLGE